MFSKVEFEPLPFLRDGHLMTVAPTIWPRRFGTFARKGEKRLFVVEDGVQVLAHCHWQKNKHDCPTMIILHGLEGCSESHYVLGLARKAFAVGMNAIRLNLRNCGGSMHLTPTLYHAGLSQDIVAVCKELKNGDGLQKLFLAGYSLGGNIILKAAGELGSEASRLFGGMGTVSPAIDLNLSVEAIEHPQNKFYEKFFLFTLKQKIREKARLYPELYDLTHLQTIKSIRQFDDIYTAPNAGYGNAANYYKTASALNVLPEIQVPTLMIAAKDDPLVPFDAFEKLQNKNEYIKRVATIYGGHAGFLHKVAEKPPIFDNFWAENRIVDFCLEVMGAQIDSEVA